MQPIEGKLALLYPNLSSILKEFMKYNVRVDMWLRSQEDWVERVD